MRRAGLTGSGTDQQQEHRKEQDQRLQSAQKIYTEVRLPPGLVSRGTKHLEDVQILQLHHTHIVACCLAVRSQEDKRQAMMTWPDLGACHSAQSTPMAASLQACLASDPVMVAS